MYTLIQFVLLCTVLTSASIFPQKPENCLTPEHQLTTSQKQLLAKDSGSKPEPCKSSPTPGCSRRDNVSDMLKIDS